MTDAEPVRPKEIKGVDGYDELGADLGVDHRREQGAGSRGGPAAGGAGKAALNMITVRYAQALPEITFNAVTPGEVANRTFAATDMNNHTGRLTVTEGTDPIIQLAMIGADGPTGTFTDRLGPVPW